jgi:hypothetical protein
LLYWEETAKISGSILILCTLKLYFCTSLIKTQKMYSFKSSLYAILAFVVLFSACKKDEESVSDKLTAVSCWKNTKSELYDEVKKAWEAEPIEACIADNCLTFKADGKIATDEGASKCDPDDDQTGSGTWKLSTDSKQVTLTDNAFPIPLLFTISELTASKMVLEIDFGGDKFRETYEKK